MNEHVKIVSKMNGKVITVSQGQKQTKPGCLIMEGYTGSPNQHWEVVFVGQHFGIKSLADPKKYVDVPGESQRVYEKLIAYEFNGNKNQKWFLHPQGQQCYKIQSVLNNLVMEVEGGIDADGVGIVQNKDYGNTSQLWRFDKI